MYINVQKPDTLNEVELDDDTVQVEILVRVKCSVSS